MILKYLLPALAAIGVIYAVQTVMRQSQPVIAAPPVAPAAARMPPVWTAPPPTPVQLAMMPAEARRAELMRMSMTDRLRALCTLPRWFRHDRAGFRELVRSTTDEGG